MKEESLLLLSDLQKLINQVVLIDYTIIILGGDSAWLVKLKRSCSANTAGMILSSRQCVVIVVCRFSGVLTAIFCINISDRKK